MLKSSIPSNNTHTPFDLQKKLIRFKSSFLSFPLIAGLLFLLIFGVFLPDTGFFWDDWVQLLSKHLYGPPAYFQYFYERPLSGWTHIVFGSLLGDSSLRWQIFTLSLRWACVCTAWWLFQLIWPHYKRQAALAAVIFAVYPGFTQQAISVAYHQHWLQYLFFLLSLAFMVLSQYKKRYIHLFLIAAALIFQGLQLSITEFFVGVEFLRPLILWVVLTHLSDENKTTLSLWQRTTKTLLSWMPYLALLAVYSVWRLFFMPLPDGHQNTPTLFNHLLSQPFDALLNLAYNALIDASNSLIVVWGKVFDLQLANFHQPMVFFSWGISLIIAVGLGIFLTRLHPDPHEVSQMQSPHHSLEWIVIGLLGVVVSNAPLWATENNILWAMDEDIYHSSRFTLAAMLWASLLMVGLISWMMERWKAKVFFVAALVGLVAGFQVRNANDYRWLSLDQSRFYWQLSWRAPFIKQGTALISEEILFPYQGTFATAGAINLLYPQQKNPDQVAYWAYALKPRFDNDEVDINSVSFNTKVRLFTFKGQTPDSLFFSYGTSKSNCLWILRPDDADFSDLSALTKKWLPVSSLKRIEQTAPDNSLPSVELFGAEPEHGWCYFYEKADLARQYSDWQSAAGLADEALRKGYSPTQSGSNSIFEWQPFIEAYAHVGRWKDAADLMIKNLEFDPKYAPFVCSRWKKLYNNLYEGDGRTEANQAVLETAGCRF